MCAEHLEMLKIVLWVQGINNISVVTIEEEGDLVLFVSENWHAQKWCHYHNEEGKKHYPGLMCSKRWQSVLTNYLFHVPDVYTRAVPGDPPRDQSPRPSAAGTWKGAAATESWWEADTGEEWTRCATFQQHPALQVIPKTTELRNRGVIAPAPSIASAPAHCPWQLS